VKQRVLTAILLFAVVVGVLFFDPSKISVAILLVAVSFVGSTELEKLLGWNARKISVPITILVISQIFCQFFLPAHWAGFWIGAAVLLQALAPSSSFEYYVRRSTPAFCLVAGLIAISAMALSRNGTIPLLLVAAIPIWCGDTAAIFAGKAFGKHKMAPKISPHKTWEGGIANVFACLVAAIVVGHYAKLALPNSILLGINCGIMGQIGDLYESQLKREAGVKDSGTILPGHGGVLDRLDSLLASAPLSLLVTVFHFR
jgi:phosphatidate cytidylyltransferase